MKKKKQIANIKIHPGEKVNISRLKVNVGGVRLAPRAALNGEREKKAADLLAAQMTPTPAGVSTEPDEAAHFKQRRVGEHTLAAAFQPLRAPLPLRSGEKTTRQTAPNSHESREK